MDTVSPIGLGEHCFHLYAQDALGRMGYRKKLMRSQMFTLVSGHARLHGGDGSMCGCPLDRTSTSEIRP